MRCAISCAFCFVIVLAAGAPTLGEMAHPMLEEEAPGFKLNTLSGDSVGLVDYRGTTALPGR